ncbi:MAG: DUF4390 domain-containing protein, partial [Desulfovibrio sp.]|nr:DUF4390 domain-containing protein [Desulfovibrio sp.]
MSRISARAFPRLRAARGGGFFFGLCLFCFLALVPVSPCQSASPQRFLLENPQLAERDGLLFFSASLSVEEEGALRDLLKDGAVLELIITTTLDRRRSWWTNAEVASHVYTSSIRHDQLTRNFLLSQPCEGEPGE